MKLIKWIFLVLLASVLGPLFFISAMNLFSDVKPIVALVSGTATAKDITRILLGHISAAVVSATALGVLFGLVPSQKPRLIGFAASGISSLILLTLYFRPPTSTKLSIYSIEIFALLVFTLVCAEVSLLAHRLKSREA